MTVPIGKSGVERKWVGVYARDSALAAPIRSLLNILTDMGAPTSVP